MAEETVFALDRFQQLRNRQNDLYRKNTQLIKEAAKAGDRDAVRSLKKARADLGENDRRIMDAELAFARTQLDQSEAEKRLGEQTRRANEIVRKIDKIGEFMNGVVKFAGVLADLAKRFV